MSLMETGISSIRNEVLDVSWSFRGVGTSLLVKGGSVFIQQFLHFRFGRTFFKFSTTVLCLGEKYVYSDTGGMAVFVGGKKFSSGVSAVA